ncbi:hypothetical protein RND81_02G091800 [Saponaria officinalis]|uniref:Uncharacterized protein n=1 Tax=Saponaria officinalis TaxID=3572 RepID=A0AAW1MKH3_SAPOF
MMKLANIFKSRGNTFGQSLNRNNSVQGVFKGYANFSTASTGDRISAAFSLYKGKAALSAEPVAPKFLKNEAGNLYVKRTGSILLSFSPSVGERKYDWERKQKFALSPTEVGSLISLGPTGSCDFFHDPGLKTSASGEVRKTLQIRSNADGTGYFLSLSVVDNKKKLNERITVQVTSAEFAVMRTSFSFALPHIIGWDHYANKPPSLTGNSSAKLGQKQFGTEWDK